MFTETLIVGQGISGTTLALQLKEKKKGFLIVDNNQHRSSSLVVAGLYNPMIFRKPSKSYNADVLIPHLKSFYTKWEETLNANFHQSRNIIRIFGSVEECNNWSIKPSHTDYSKFLLPELHKENFDANLH